MKPVVALGLLLGLAACTSAYGQATLLTQSPDGHLAVEFTNTAGGVRYSVRRDDRLLLTPSRLGITVDGRDLGFGATLNSIRVKDAKDEFAVVGGHARASVAYAEATLPVRTAAPATDWTIECRVFNDAVAYRYRVPGNGTRQVAGDASEWRLPADSQLWFQPHNRAKDYEAHFQFAKPYTLPLGTMIAAPALLKLPGNDGYALVTEANLVNYSDMALTAVADGGFKANFHNDAAGFELDGEIVTPWRVMILARDLNGLVNTDVIQSLAPPPAPELANADWIKPGRSVWHWRVTGHPKFEQQRQWVDWAAALGFEYHLVDDGWKVWAGDGKDAWAMLKDVVDYGKSKNVAIIAWAHSKELTRPEDRLAYMQKAKEIGLVGLKIDFMKPADVEWVKWYDDTLRDAAKFHLLIDYHGALKPTGRERTWPNELNREGIAGREQGKLSGLHDTTLPFTRFVQGHADYTPTDFRPTQLKGNTVAKELAQAVVYTSPLLCYSGVPQDYLDSPAAAVIKAIPATWDETIVLPGSAVGDVAAFARRRGDVWFVGVINGTDARTLPIDFSFLKPGSYKAVILGDTAGKPEAFDRSEKDLTPQSLLPFQLSKDGGVVIQIKPAA